MNGPGGGPAGGLVLNNSYADPNDGLAHAYRLATLREPGDASAYDHMRMLITLNSTWGSLGNSYIDATLAGRAGLAVQYTVRGAPLNSSARLVVYQNGQAGTFDVYLRFDGGSPYTSGSYTVLENQQETVYPNPVDFGNAIPGSVRFDSSYSNFPPASSTDYSSNVTIGGNIAIKGAGGLTFADGTSLTSANGNNSSVNSAGETTFTNDVTVSGQPLGVNAGNTTNLLTLQNYNSNASKLAFFQIRNAAGTAWDTTTTRLQLTTDVTTQGYMDFNPSNGLYGLAFGSGGTEYLRIANGGNIGIGTSAPGAKLEVSGNVKLTYNSGANMTFQDGTVQSTAWNGTTLGGDYAESVDVVGSRETYSPGDIVSIDATNPSHFTKSLQAYSKLVAGVFSTKPGLVGRRVNVERPNKEAEVPIALLGIVPARVSAENGPIEPGDLLVSSSTPGVAMKGTDSSRMMGAVLGKAMGTLSSGTALIEILLALQ